MNNIWIKSPISKKKTNNVLNVFILILSLIGIIITTLEVYLNSKGTSICKTQGCTIVHIFDVHHILNYLGMTIFFVIFVFTLFKSKELQVLRSLILAVCIVIEGYFIGFQLWYVKELCYFCLLVAGLIFLIFLLDFFSSKVKTIGLTGIIGFLSLLIATYLVNIPLTSLDLKSPVIIYQRGCPHCKAVIEYAKKHKIKINTYPVDRVYALMKILDLNSVPVMIYRKNKSEIFMINGESNIEGWLIQEMSNRSLLLNTPEIFIPVEGGGACRIDQLNCK